MEADSQQRQAIKDKGKPPAKTKTASAKPSGVTQPLAELNIAAGEQRDPVAVVDMAMQSSSPTPAAGKSQPSTSSASSVKAAGSNKTPTTPAADRQASASCFGRSSEASSLHAKERRRLFSPANDSRHSHNGSRHSYDSRHSCQSSEEESEEESYVKARGKYQPKIVFPDPKNLNSEQKVDVLYQFFRKLLVISIIPLAVIVFFSTNNRYSWRQAFLPCQGQLPATTEAHKAIEGSTCQARQSSTS